MYAQSPINTLATGNNQTREKKGAQKKPTVAKICRNADSKNAKDGAARKTNLRVIIN